MQGGLEEGWRHGIPLPWALHVTTLATPLAPSPPAPCTFEPLLNPTGALPLPLHLCFLTQSLWRPPSWPPCTCVSPLKSL